MPEVFEQTEAWEATRPASVPPLAPSRDADRLARDDLRRQIGKLERELGETFASAFPRRGIDWRVGALGGPRVLSIGELEEIRDGLANRIADVRGVLGDRA